MVSPLDGCSKEIVGSSKLLTQKLFYDFLMKNKCASEKA
jgi:hypothetical protein